VEGKVEYRGGVWGRRRYLKNGGSVRRTEKVIYNGRVRRSGKVIYNGCVRREGKVIYKRLSTSGSKGIFIGGVYGWKEKWNIGGCMGEEKVFL
jgi:hypothetical protein